MPVKTSQCEGYNTLFKLHHHYPWSVLRNPENWPADQLRPKPTEPMLVGLFICRSWKLTNWQFQRAVSHWSTDQSVESNSFQFLKNTNKGEMTEAIEFLVERIRNQHAFQEKSLLWFVCFEIAQSIVSSWCSLSKLSGFYSFQDFCLLDCFSFLCMDLTFCCRRISSFYIFLILSISLFSSFQWKVLFFFFFWERTKRWVSLVVFGSGSLRWMQWQ